MYAIASASPDIGWAGAVASYVAMLGAVYLGARSRLDQVVVVASLAAAAIIAFGSLSPSSRDGWEALWWLSVLIFAAIIAFLAVFACAVAAMIRRRHRNRLSNPPR